MRIKILLVSAAVLLLCFNLSGAADFEGKISQRGVYLAADAFENVTSMSQADKLFSKSVDELKQMAVQTGDDEAYSEERADIYIRGNSFLIETQQEGQRVTVIFDSQSSKITTLVHDEKMAMVTDMNQMTQMGEQMAGAMGAAPGMTADEMEEDRFSMKSAGETKTINGFKCELYKGTDSEGGLTHIWIHKGYADVFETLVTAFSRLDASENAGLGKEEAFFKQIKGIPILTQSVSMGEVSIDEIKEISKQSVSKDMFKVPADYQQMDMQEMMQQQMKQMQEMMQQE